MSQNDTVPNPALLFQKMTINSASDVLTLWSDREAVRKTNWPFLENLVAVEERLARAISYYNHEDNIGIFSVLNADREFVGMIGAGKTKSRDGEFEVWYFLNRKFRGKGLGREMLKGFLPLIYQNKNVKTLVATALVENPASWKILESQGFQRTEMMVGGHVKDGLVADLYEYSLELKN